MPFYVGNVMNPGGPIPQVLYHTQQFAQDTTMPNYGTNQTVPELLIPYPSNAYTYPPDGPTVEIYNYVGECKTSQFIVSWQSTTENNYFYIDHTDYTISTALWWYLSIDHYANDYIDVALKVYEEDPANPGFGLYLAEVYCQWDPIPAATNNKYTLLVGIDPNVDLDGLGPDNGRYYLPGNWPAKLNGADPNAYPPLPNTYNVYGVETGYAPTSCANWISNGDGDFYIDSFRDFDDPQGGLLGFAAFRDQPIFNAEDFDYWANDHDWLSDPGYV